MGSTRTTTSRQKFDLQTRETSGAPESRRNMTITSNIGAANNCINMPDYFRSSTNWETAKRASRLLTMKRNNDFSDIFTCTGCFDENSKWCNSFVLLPKANAKVGLFLDLARLNKSS